jgi:hypothetical protein
MLSRGAIYIQTTRFSVVSILCRGNKAEAPDDWMQMTADEHTRQASPSAFQAISAHVVINWNQAPSEFHLVAAGR